MAWIHIWLNESKAIRTRINWKGKKNVRNRLFEGQHLAIILWNTETIKHLNGNNIAEICLRRICVARGMKDRTKKEEKEWKAVGSIGSFGSFGFCVIIISYLWSCIKLYAWIYGENVRGRDNLVLVFYWCPSDLSFAETVRLFRFAILAPYLNNKSKQSTWSLVCCFISELWLFHWLLLHFNEKQSFDACLFLFAVSFAVRTSTSVRTTKILYKCSIVVSKTEAHYKRTTF